MNILRYSPLSPQKKDKLMNVLVWSILLLTLFAISFASWAYASAEQGVLALLDRLLLFTI